MSKLSALILIFISGICYSQYNAEKNYYIIGDNVNVREDSNIHSDVVYQVDFGMEFQGDKVNKDWYYWTADAVAGYISSKYVVGPERFLKIAEARPNKNGETLISLENVYKKLGQLEKAENLSIEIINNYKNQYFPIQYEACPLYGEVAFNGIVYNEKYELEYKDQHLLNYCKRIIAESKDSLISLWAMHLLARCYLKTNNEPQAKVLILKCFKDYSEYFVVPDICEDYSMENKYIFLEELKKTIGWFQKDMLDEMRKICNDNKLSIMPKSVACDVLARSKY